MEKSIGEIIKEYRIQSGLTQEELANEMGISRVLLSGIERGEKEVTEGSARLMTDAFTMKNVPKPFLQRYREGQNFAKIITTLRETGVTLAQLRHKDFQTVGTELSYMYIGMKPISEKIKKVLSDEYKVNLDFIEKGNKVAMFQKRNETDKLELPYFKGVAFDIAIANHQNNKYDNATIFPFLNYDIEFFVDISMADNIFPTFQGKEILGLKKAKYSSDYDNRLFVVKTKNKPFRLRRIKLNNNSHDKCSLSKENKELASDLINIKEIEECYLVKCIINPDFL